MPLYYSFIATRTDLTVSFCRINCIQIQYLYNCIDVQVFFNRLQRIVNTAARILCRIPKFGHISETLMDLHWLPVQQRVLFKVLILTYQAYHKTAPSYLCDLITPYSKSCNLGSNNQLLLASCQPRTKLKTYGERSFQHAAPNEWNNLQLIIRVSPSLAIFKNKLKTFLFESTYST